MLTNLNISGLKVEMAKQANRHVKRTLPPSLSGFPGMAEVKYYVKATVVRPQFYKENLRAVSGVAELSSPRTLISRFLCGQSTSNLLDNQFDLSPH
jgi:hypothetical protein